VKTIKTLVFFFYINYNIFYINHKIEHFLTRKDKLNQMTKQDNNHFIYLKKIKHNKHFVIS